MRTIGVLGGMGPAAGADFYSRVVAAHGAQRDQEHPPCVLYSATGVPDRTAHLLGHGADPRPALVAAAGVLEAAGAEFIVIPCNSAHAFLDDIREAVGVPVADMIGLAVAAIAPVAPDASTVGMLAATGTVTVGLYDRPIAESGRGVLYPDGATQDEVMAAIRGVKGGCIGAGIGTGGRPEPDQRLVDAAAGLADRGADCLIMGCTEVPLALRVDDCPIPAIDASEVLVQTTLDLATGREEIDAVR